MLVPFLGKPIHLDDPMYIWAAQQILIHPGDFYGFNVNWAGHVEPMPVPMMNPPLLPYYLALTAHFWGSSEIALHAALLPLTLLTVIAFYLLARQFCRFPLVPCLMLLVCPAFIISSTTLMCEVPVLSLWLWALVLWMRGTDRHPCWFPVAGLLAGLAILTKYSAICLLPLLLVYMAIRPVPWHRRWQGMALLLIPLAMIVFYNQCTAVRYGRGLFSNAIGFSSSYDRQHGSSTAAKLLDALCFAGTGALAPAVAALLTGGRLARCMLLTLVPLMAWAASRLFAPPGGWSNPWPFFVEAGLMAATGLWIAWACLRQLQPTAAGDFGRTLFLLLWTGGVFIFAVKLNWSINARSILPMVPAFCLLVQRGLEAGGGASLRGCFAGCIVSALVSVLAMGADYQSAAANRLASLQLTRQYAGSPIWFTGHWGFQYYMQQHGAMPLDDQHPQCKPGDLVVVPLNNYGNPPRSLRLKAVGSLSVGTCSFLSLLDGPLGADYYFSPGDRLPMVFGSITPDGFVVFRVVGK